MPILLAAAALLVVVLVTSRSSARSGAPGSGGGGTLPPTVPVTLTPQTRVLTVDGRRVFVHIPAGADARNVVVYFHGHGQAIDTLGPALAPVFDQAVARPIVVMPQLGAKSEPGTLNNQNGLRTLLAGVFAATGAPLPNEPIVVMAHSGGYVAAARAVSVGGVHVRAVGLLDALYGLGDVFDAYASPSTRFVNVYGPSTEAPSLQLASKLITRLGALAVLDTSGGLVGAGLTAAVRGHRAVTARTKEGHSAVPAATIVPILNGFYGS